MKPCSCACWLRAVHLVSSAACGKGDTQSWVLHCPTLFIQLMEALRVLRSKSSLPKLQPSLWQRLSFVGRLPASPPRPAAVLAYLPEVNS